MNSSDHHLAAFLGSKTSPRRTAWDALPDAERRERQQQGIAAWKAWAERHHAAIVASGGPLGTTGRVSDSGVEETSNDLSAFMVVRAASHAAAAQLFERHPHFAIFPGDCVEVMPILPVPGA